MRRVRASIGAAAAFAAMAAAAPGPAQMHDHASMHDHPMPADSAAAMPMDHEMPMDHAMPMHGHAAMTGLYGSYPMTREASGTSWQPDRARHLGVHRMAGRWMLMLHGFADLVADDQGGPRGDEKRFGANMIMGMARRDLGPGRLGVRAMLSAEPATIGKRGYPLLLQTGETSDGRTPLIDRQHPHDLFMELSLSYSLSSGSRSVFLYGGLPGEPALGPPAFMHRFSGAAFPQAPITHHWLDSSHITFGVLTAGAVAGAWKVEASAFRGREPDENRWDVETPKLDSHAFRLSWNPTPALALQASRGRLKGPESLEPGIDIDRTTASAIWAADLKPGHAEVTAAWGRNRDRPGPALDAFTAEAALEIAGRHTVFARAERVEKNELVPEGDPRAGTVYDVGSWSGGYRFDLWKRGHAAAGIGILATVAAVPAGLRGDYGTDPRSTMLFARVTLR